MIVVILSLCQTLALAANDFTLDVYGTKKLSADKLRETYKKEWNAVTDAYAGYDPANPKKMEKKIKKAEKAMHKVISGIKKMGDFAYVHPTAIAYPYNHKVGITIDIVETQDKKRLAVFNNPPSQALPDPGNLLQEQEAYEKLGTDLMLTHAKRLKYKECAKFHCEFEFENSQLEQYSAMFDKEVPKHKAELIAILRNDKDSEKRAKAALLLAHTKDGNELLNILLPSINDPVEGVRNDVIRVIAMTLRKVHPKQFPVEKFVAALDFPGTLDRNKALFAIVVLVKNPEYADYVKKHASQQLLDNLKMQQPNVHELAYEALTTMSGKHYGERDYKAWEQWVKA